MAKRNNNVNIHAIHFTKKSYPDIWNWINAQRNLTDSVYMLIKFAQAVSGNTDWRSEMARIIAKDPKLLSRKQSHHQSSTPDVNHQPKPSSLNKAFNSKSNDLGGSEMSDIFSKK